MAARPAAPATGDAVAAVVNGSPLAALEMAPGDREYRWRVPRGIWVDGTNELVLEPSATTRPSDAGSPDARELGVAVTSLRILRE